MNATDELRRLLDERGVEYVPSVWSAKDETFYKVGEVGYLATELSSGRMKVCIEGYPTPAQVIDATLGRGTCRFVWSLADNGWADHTCSACGYVENTDVHVRLGWKYCPNCGARVVDA